MQPDSQIFVAGHRGLVGSAILRRLEREGCRNLLVRTRAELDLTDPLAVDALFSSEKIEYVFLAAAKVGGILANSSFPADFIRDNLLIQTNVIHSAWRHGVRKLAFLGSSCIYPKLAPQPITEDSLLTGPLEATNESYAIAKIAGIKMAQAYRQQHGFNAINLMPTNLYGPGDNFDLESSHVLPALMRKIHDARAGNAAEVVIWGSGTPRREFLHVDDLADAGVFLMRHYDDAEIVNVGTGKDITILELAELLQRLIGYRGKIVFDKTKPDGTPRKLLSCARLQTLGWSAKIPLENGIRATYEWFLKQRVADTAGTG